MDTARCYRFEAQVTDHSARRNRRTQRFRLNACYNKTYVTSSHHAYYASCRNPAAKFLVLYPALFTDDSKYVLALKDDISGYCWLAPTSNANGEFAAATLARWNRTFSAPSFWVSDQGPHFINEVLETMAKSHNIVHKPTVAYSPWANAGSPS